MSDFTSNGPKHQEPAVLLTVKSFRPGCLPLFQSRKPRNNSKTEKKCQLNVGTETIFEEIFATNIESKISTHTQPRYIFEHLQSF